MDYLYGYQQDYTTGYQEIPGVGWECPNCHNWIPAGQEHYCPGLYYLWPPLYPFAGLTDAQGQRIIELLETIVELLTKEE